MAWSVSCEAGRPDNDRNVVFRAGAVAQPIPREAQEDRLVRSMALSYLLDIHKVISLSYAW